MGTLGSILSVGFNAAHRQSTNHFTTLRDYQHASNIFRPNNGQLLPKSKNWFHIFFQLDQTVVIPALNAALKSATDNDRLYWDASTIPTLGVLAKTVKLPNFKFDVVKKNQYNRWNLTATKLNYEPIDISFWDDTLDIIRGFWYAYYQYMNQDPRYVDFQAAQSQGLNIPTEWQPTTGGASSVYSTVENWAGHFGLDTANSASSPLSRTRSFFNSIRIYQITHALDSDRGAEFEEYVLVNPLISSFDHDTSDFSSSDFMTNKMTIEYETVLYNSGPLDNDEVASWEAVKAQFFDNTPSPLTNTNPKANNLNQLGGVLSSSVQLGTEIIQRGLNTGQATTATVLTQSVGTATAILQSQNNAAQSLAMQVPTVITGYGTSGLPPTLPTTPVAPNGVTG